MDDKIGNVYVLMSQEGG